MIRDLRQEEYFGEDTPLVPDEHGNYTRPVNFRKRYYRILEAAGIEKKGLHSFWYFDEQGIKRRKVFSSKTKTEAQQKITNYIAQFNEEVHRAYHNRQELQGILQIKKDEEKPGGKAILFPQYPRTAD